MCKGLRRMIQAESVLANSSPAKASSSRNFSLGISFAIEKVGGSFQVKYMAMVNNIRVT